jgi:hypothetical protein
MGKIMAARTARQECVRISINCVALAVLTAAVLIIGVGVPSWIADGVGSEDAAYGAVLGGIATIAASGLLLLISIMF